jgi:3-keto-L-gulonate-6-phosphate decarboxylase
MVVEHGMWRIRSNEELRDVYKDLDVVADIKRCDWNGLDM